MPSQDLVNKKYPNLPDAPTLFTAHTYEAESPYHVAAANRERKYQALAQIRLMATAFVSDFSSKTEGKLDFSLKSLEEVDKVIGSFVPAKPENVDVFVHECGSYVGVVLEGYTPRKGQWHVSFPKYYFSGFRLPFKDTKGKLDAIVETNPFAQVTKKIAAVLEKRPDSEPGMVRYISWILEGFKRAEQNPARPPSV